jgi:hypothetical protein
MVSDEPTAIEDRVEVDRYGEVRVDGRVVAPKPGLPLWSERIVAEVRRRTLTDWWVVAASIAELQVPLSTGGPLGAGVDFFVEGEGLDPAFPPEVCGEIQWEAY